MDYNSPVLRDSCWFDSNRGYQWCGGEIPGKGTKMKILRAVRYLRFAQDQGNLASIRGAHRRHISSHFALLRYGM